MNENNEAPTETKERDGSAFLTPIKPRGEGEPFREYLTPYFSSKFKGIASKIRSNVHKRFRVREEAGERKLVFWSELKQVSEISKSKQSSTSARESRESLTADEAHLLAKKTRGNMLKLQRNNI